MIERNQSQQGVKLSPRRSICAFMTSSIKPEARKVSQRRQTARGGPSYGHRYHTHPFNGPLSGTTQVSRYQKGNTNIVLNFTEARDSEWQWHRLDHMQVCTSLQADNHASTPPLSFLQAGYPSCRPTSSVKALKAQWNYEDRTCSSGDMLAGRQINRQTNTQTDKLKAILRHLRGGG